MEHKGLRLENWSKLPLVVQMAHIGSEVFRALQWKGKGNEEYANSANIRALELFDLTLASMSKPARLKEVARARELWLDFFIGNNIYKQTEDQWKKYFFAFTFASQIKK